MPYQIGEKVVFLKEPGGGKITKIIDATFYILDETGFERPFKINEIAKRHSTDYQYNEVNPIGLQKNVLASTNSTTQSYTVYKDYWEIDLHLENLLELFGDKLVKHKNQALVKQLAIFKDAYYKALKKKVRKIIVIHGYGKGVLRQEIQVFLRGQEGVDFFDAPYTEYGHGAIQVEIKYNY